MLSWRSRKGSIKCNVLVLALLEKGHTTPHGFNQQPTATSNNNIGRPEDKASRKRFEYVVPGSESRRMKFLTKGRPQTGHNNSICSSKLTSFQHQQKGSAKFVICQSVNGTIGGHFNSPLALTLIVTAKYHESHK